MDLPVSNLFFSIKRTVLSVLLIIISTGITFSEGVSLQGTVIDYTNDAVISQAQLKLESTNLSVKKNYETSSDLLGKYKFELLEQGEYKLTVTRLGYKKETVEDIIITGTKAINLNIPYTCKHRN